MAERAHPDDPGFQKGFKLTLKGGIFPWFTYRKSNPYVDAFHWRYRWVEGFCRGRDVLDIPCGMGWGTSLIRGCNRLVGMDISEEAIAEARRRYGRKAEFQQADMAALPCPDESFDIVSCLEGIEHVSVDVGREFIDEAWRVLKPEGKLLISSPHCVDAPHSGNPYHVHEYSADEIQALLEIRFRVVLAAERPVSNLVVSYLVATKTRGTGERRGDE